MALHRIAVRSMQQAVHSAIGRVSGDYSLLGSQAYFALKQCLVLLKTQLEQSGFSWLKVGSKSFTKQGDFLKVVAKIDASWLVGWAKNGLLLGLKSKRLASTILSPELPFLKLK